MVRVSLRVWPRLRCLLCGAKQAGAACVRTRADVDGCVHGGGSGDAAAEWTRL